MYGNGSMPWVMTHVKCVFSIFLAEYTMYVNGSMPWLIIHVEFVFSNFFNRILYGSGNMHWVMTHVSCGFCLFWAFERDGLTYLYMYIIHCLQLV